MILDFLKNELQNLKDSKNYRVLKIIQNAQHPRVMVDGKEYIMLASSSYLGLSIHPKLIAASQTAVEEFGVGSSGSRLITGNMTLHESLEYALTRFHGTEDTILFNSGYDANLGVISTLMKKSDVIFSDELNHASIIDGSRLSRSEVRIYNHNDMTDLERHLRDAKSSRKPGSRFFIITDSVFSMDGDLANLIELAELASDYDAYLMLDEAHAVGVFGAHGRGLAEEQKMEGQVDILMGALSKAFGTSGGYISGTEELVDILRNRARSFVFTTSLPPSVIASSLASLEVVRSEPELREQLWKNIDYFKSNLDGIGYNTMSSASQIIPMLIGSSDKTMELSKALFNHGIFLNGIRPPTVPEGSSRLRATMLANHTKQDIDEALSVFKTIQES
jgi:8-amino-7-oxononanoate synthase